jgi:ABC-type antimicrobial peptide transport system permease subunit
VLVEAPAEDAPAVATVLRRDLADFGATVEGARESLGRFMAVANSYISAFQMLGGLGMLLGSLGLVAVLARGVIERRGEIALLRALGFTRWRAAALLVWENSLLLVAGLAGGAASAAVAVAPELARSGLAVTAAALTCCVLVSIIVVVTLATTCAAVRLLRGVSPESLRRE